MLSEETKFKIRMSVKAYVLYETWLARYCDEHGDTPSEEQKREMKAKCYHMAYETQA